MRRVFEIVGDVIAVASLAILLVGGLYLPLLFN